MSQPGDALTSLASAASSAGPARGLPPVHLWHPEQCGRIDIVIRRDGSWWHEGAVIGRPALVRLFSTVLRKDADGYVLVTPAEKLSIKVEDVPFIAVRVDRAGEALSFTTNVGDTVEAGPDHSLRVETDPVTRAPSPYVHVRGSLEARLSRAVFYDLVAMAEERDGRLGMTSRGAWFDLGAVA